MYRIVFHGKVIFYNPRHPGLRSLCVDDFRYGHVLDRTLLKNSNYTSLSILPSAFFHLTFKNTVTYIYVLDWSRVGAGG